jgi:transcriptional regulator with XRE-family HTH domain
MVVKKKAAEKNSNETSVKARPVSSVSVPEDQIGDRIREAREAMGLTQVGLATRTKLIDVKGEGISRTVIIGYEAGNYKPGAREMRILCETLSITPNWLLYRKETPFEVTQASMHFMRGKDEVTAAVRLAMAAMLLKPHERDLIASLVLSIGGRAIGDSRLSGLLVVASFIADTVREDLAKHIEGFRDNPLPISELIEAVSEEMTTNWGNKLQFDEEGVPVAGEWLYPDPKAVKGKKQKR